MNNGRDAFYSIASLCAALQLFLQEEIRRHASVEWACWPTILISRYGECHVAINGQEAVEAFRLSLENGRRYNLVCMDIMMPEKDGQFAVREIRVMEESAGFLSTSGSKIIMITALDDVQNVVASFKALCDAYIFKPVDIAQLLTQLKSMQLVP